MRVYGELPVDAGGVEAPVIDPGTLPPGGVRRWGWLPLLAMALAALGYARLVTSRAGDAPGWLLAAGSLALAAAAVAMLVRYTDDRATIRTRVDRGALAEASDPRIGTVTRAADGISARSAQTREVTFETADGPVTVRWVLGVSAHTSRALPRQGDPVAVWVARDRDAVLLRYERAWAQEILDMLPPTAPPAIAETDGSPSDDEIR